jgi:uncharacterized damage-inducible protein DinB
MGVAQKESMSSRERDVPVFCQEYIGQIDFVKGRIMDLANTVPQDKYTWRPADGVRSVSEVYRHVAFANYAFIKWSGYEVPAEAGFHTDLEKWDKATTDKAEIATTLNKSFDAIQATVKLLTTDELNKTVQVFGMEMSLRNFMMSSLSHLHEHLGQSVAYARSNAIVPPWTAKAQQKEKAKEK